MKIVLLTAGGFLALACCFMAAIVDRPSRSESGYDNNILCDRHGHAVYIHRDWLNRTRLLHVPGINSACLKISKPAVPQKQNSNMPPSKPPFRMSPPGDRMPPREITRQWDI